VAGKVAQAGEDVTHLEVGQRVGLDWHAGDCMTCPSCMGGDHNLCDSGQGTIVGRHRSSADKVRARAASVAPLPDGIGSDYPGPRSVSGSPVWSLVAVAATPEFAARYDFKPVIETFLLDRVDDAIEHLRSGRARYRTVLDS
jgi:uncharacterized zinc-type alcohol dehydrogenase-like protein